MGSDTVTSHTRKQQPAKVHANDHRRPVHDLMTCETFSLALELLCPFWYHNDSHKKHESHRLCSPDISKHLTCTVQETFEDTLVCVGLRRIVIVAFLCRVQIFLLTYLLLCGPDISNCWQILLNQIKQYLKTTLSVHTKFFHIVNTFTDHYRQLDAVMTRATLNCNLQRNSEYWLHFLSCSCKHNYIIYKNYWRILRHNRLKFIFKILHKISESQPRLQIAMVISVACYLYKVKYLVNGLTADSNLHQSF